MANHQEIHWSEHQDLSNIRGMSCQCPDGTMRCPWGNEHKLVTSDDEQIVKVYEADENGTEITKAKDKFIQITPDAGVYPTDEVIIKPKRRSFSENKIRQIVIQYSDSPIEYCLLVLVQDKGSYNEISIQI